MYPTDDEIMSCSCEQEMVLLSGTLKNEKVDGGQVWACPNCDVADKPVRKGARNIIELSRENHE